MKKLFAIVAIAALMLGSSASAVPMFDIWQDVSGDGVKDTYLGTVEAYTGTESAADNYNFFSASAHPINGPTPEAYKSKMYMYDGPDGLSFGFFHNIDAGGNNYWNHVDWDISLMNMSSSFGLSDDGGLTQSEFSQVDPNTYSGRWAYRINTDGGVIKDLTPTDTYWEIMIDPLAFGDVQDWSMYSADGSVINLWNNPVGLPTGLGSTDHYELDTDAYTTFITKSAIPEPTSMLLFGLGVAGTLVHRRLRKNK